jgi:hypothetical protein
MGHSLDDRGSFARNRARKQADLIRRHIYEMVYLVRAPTILPAQLLPAEVSCGQRWVELILSKRTVERHGLSTSIIPKGQVQEQRQTG